MNKPQQFTISELGTELDISPSTIRFYEDRGLIKPERTEGNHRVYSVKDRGRLKLILRGKRFGASLDEIAEMIGLADGRLDETDQIDKSLFYIEKKSKEIESLKLEMELMERDLAALRDKLLQRRDELTGDKS